MCLSVPNPPTGAARPNPFSASGFPQQGATSSALAAPAELQRQALARLAARAEDAFALAVSLPFCAVHCLSCERDIRAGQTPLAMHAYAQQLCREIDQLAEHMGGGRDILQLHLGGGTANLFSAASLIDLMQRLRHHWRLPGDAELSVECDPRCVGWAQLELLQCLGFNEVHFGVLDLDLRVQQAIGRMHSAALIDDACGLARACGIAGIRLGLMVGLPNQSLASWRDSLRQVIEIAPDRITLGRYRHRPGQVAGHHAIDVHALPAPAEVLDLVALSAEALRAVGYRWIGADLFVLEDDPLSRAVDEDRLRVSLLGHTALPEMPQLGVGRGVVSEFDGCMFWNQRPQQAWQAELEQGRLPVAQAWQPDKTAQARRAAAESLLCRQWLPAAMLADGLSPLYEALLREAPPGSLQRHDDGLLVTDSGRAHLHQLCAGLAGLPADLRQALPAWLN